MWDNSKRLLEHNTPIYRGGVYKKPIWVAIGIMAGIFKELKNLSVKTSSPMVITVPAIIPIARKEVLQDWLLSPLILM